MVAPLRRSLAVLVLCAVGALAIQRSAEPSEEDGLSPDVRAAGLRFAPEVTEADRAWVMAAIAGARPEARRLIDEVDGVVTVRTQHDLGGAVGMAQVVDGSATIVLSTGALNGDRAIDRQATVLHELGHVVDHLLVPDDLMQRLDAGIPRIGTCTSPSHAMGPCTAVEERFAETFAKWALGGRVSLAGSGYGIPAPASIEDWGAPLGLLAARLGR